MCNENKPLIRLLSKEEEQLEEGIQLITMQYECQNGTTFWSHAIIANPANAYMVTGTANGSYESINSTALVPDHMKSALEEGLDVIAGINCGYFRRKDRCRPYGLSIRKGVEIAPPYSEPHLVCGNVDLGRRWLGMTEDHEIIYGTVEDYPEHKEKLVYATSFTHFLVKDGKINYDENVPAAEPRSTFALRKDGTIIMSAIDGRQPGYSDGCTMFENAQMMLDLGADIAFHIDGGGSSNLSIVDSNGEIKTINRPCEQRKVYDTLLLIRRH